MLSRYHTLSLLFVCSLSLGCVRTEAVEAQENADCPLQRTVGKKVAEEDPLLLALVLASQPIDKEIEGNGGNDLCAIILQQVAVGWAAQGRMKEAEWGFARAIEYARRTRQKSNSRLRGLADSCLESKCYEQALEAARFLRVEDRSRVFAEVSRAMAERGDKEAARELLQDASDRLDSNLQAGGSAKNRAYRAIGLAHSVLGDQRSAEEAFDKGGKVDPSWPPVVRIRNHLEVGRLALHRGLLKEAVKHGKLALALSKRQKDEEVMVLTAIFLHEAGEHNLAKSALDSIDPNRALPQRVQGLARIGEADEALKLLSLADGKSRAEGLYLVSAYLHEEKHKIGAVNLLRGVDSRHQDWRTLQTVAELCARTGDVERAHRYYRNSLIAYRRDWPQLWRNPHQRAFVVANFGREMAQAKLDPEPSDQKAYEDVVETLSWPQSIRI